MKYYKWTFVMPYVELDDGKRIFYEDHGKGFPVLFGHSYLWDSKMWAPQVEELKSRFRCIVPDLWGHGFSDNDNIVRDAITIEELADDYTQFADKIGLDEIIVVGLSVGGMWGTHMALSHTKVVKGMVVMGSYVGREPEEAKLNYFGMLDMIEKLGVIPPQLADQIAPMFFSPVTLAERPEMVSRFRDSLLSIPAENIPTILKLGRGIFGRIDIVSHLKGLSIPTLFLSGRDDIPRPFTESVEMATLTPGAELQVIANAGHIANLEQPDQVTNRISEFINTVIAGL